MIKKCHLSHHFKIYTKWTCFRKCTSNTTTIQDYKAQKNFKNSIITMAPDKMDKDVCFGKLKLVQIPLIKHETLFSDQLFS